MGAFAEFRRRLEALEEVPSDVAREVAGRIKAVVQAQIAAGEDPYGNKWPGLKKGSGTPLASFAKTVKTRVSGNVVTITIADWRAKFHHAGTAKVPARSLLPSGEIPESWREAIGEEFTAAFRRRLAR